MRVASALDVPLSVLFSGLESGTPDIRFRHASGALGIGKVERWIEAACSRVASLERSPRSEEVAGSHEGQSRMVEKSNLLPRGGAGRRGLRPCQSRRWEGGPSFRKNQWPKAESCAYLCGVIASSPPPKFYALKRRRGNSSSACRPGAGAAGWVPRSQGAPPVE